MSNLANLVDAVVAAHIDIAPTYGEYLQLAFALATDCGEAGRADFHRLCSLSAKYNHDHAERLYSNCLKAGKGAVHLGTAFHLAQKAGVEVTSSTRQLVNSSTHPLAPLAPRAADTPPTHTRTREGTPGNDEVIGSEPLLRLPTLGNYAWPYPLDRILEVGSTDAERDALLLGGLTALGACMERWVRIYYGGRWISPCLQTFVVAPPASGKGVLSFIRFLVEPIHEQIRDEVGKAQKTYLRQKAAYDCKGREKANEEAPEAPLNRMFLISGNNSGTGILQNLMDSDGTGLIFEPEADTISTAIGSDYGHWSDTLRKAFDHDRLSYNRRTGGEYREVRSVYLSVLLSGTPAQVQPLIPSAENGLFSRQLFYYMPAIHRWRNQFVRGAGKNLETEFRKLGEKWQELIAPMKREQHLITLLLGDEQQARFNALFSRLFGRSYLVGSEMSSSVTRLAVNICRMLSVVARLRAYERPEWLTPAADVPVDNVKDGIISRWELRISEEDFEAVLSLTEPLYRHACHVLSFLPTTEVVRRTGSECALFLEKLPDRFSRQEALTLADELGINKNTLDSWLNRSLKRGLLLPDEEKGIYRKPSPS